MSTIKALYAAAACMLLLTSLSAQAHDEFRFVGVITKADKASFQMKSRDGKSVSIHLDGQTVVTKDKKKLDRTLLKTGDTVVVDALGDSEADLLALEVRLVPAIK